MSSRTNFSSSSLEEKEEEQGEKGRGSRITSFDAATEKGLKTYKRISKQ